MYNGTPTYASTFQISLIDINDKQVYKKAIHKKYLKKPFKRLFLNMDNPSGRYKIKLKTFKRFKYQFTHLELFVAHRLDISSLNSADVIKALGVSTPKLKLVRFRECSLSIGMVFGLYALAKDKFTREKAINVSMFRLYDWQLRNHKMEILKPCYVISLIGRYCKNILHTQTNSKVSEVAYHLFMTTAEISKRRNKDFFVSLGGRHVRPLKTTSRYTDLHQYVKIRNNLKNTYYNKDYHMKLDLLEDLNEGSFV